MKKFIILFFLASTFLLAQNGKPLVKHVVIIGVDGMSPNGIKHADTPNMDYLTENGAYTFHARSVLPSSSSPNWASMIMGAGPEQHGITSNDWETDDFTLPPVISGREKIFPTIFGIIRDQIPDAEIGAIYHWDGFGRLFEKSAVSYDVHRDSEDETAETAAEYIKSKKPLFTFVHLDHVDHAGHQDGHGTPEYFKAVGKADSLIGIILNAAKEAGIWDETLFIVSADHGGIGKGHGGETLDEMEIPFILYGQGIKKGYRITHAVNTFDNASTVAFVLGLKQPYAWIGRAVKSAFEGYDSPEGEDKKTMLNPPVIFPERNFYEPAGGLFIDQNPVVKIKSSEKDTEIRYTLDGSEPTKQSSLYTKEFELNKTSVVTAKSFGKNNEESLPVAAYFRIVNSKSANGISYKYYEGGDWDIIPAFANLTPVKNGKVYEIRTKDIEHRESQFAVEFNGLIKIEKSGKYKFYTYSDDGSKLFIDGKEVVNNDGDHGAIERSDTIKLEEGMHEIKVTYFNGGGGGWLDVFYRGPGIPKQIIPTDVLFLTKN